MIRAETASEWSLNLIPSLAERFQTPALVVFLDVARSNIRRVIDDLGGDPGRWRPHLKTTKMPLVWAELLEAGVRRFKCATTREAAVLLDLIRDRQIETVDLLVAYPLPAPGRRRLAALAEANPAVRLAVLVEDPPAAATLPEPLAAFVDLNPGMNRTGIPADDWSAILETARAAGDRLRGLHFYDGHIRHGTPENRRTEAHRGYDRLIETIDRLRSAGVDVGEVVTSGTPTYLHALSHEGLNHLTDVVHRVSPGTVVFHDAGYDEMLPELKLEPAAMVLTRVISRPAADVVTCDAGSKSIAAEAGDPCAVVLGHPELTPLKPSEEHLPLQVDGAPAPERGEALLLVPRHVCPTVNLVDEAIVIENGEFACVAPVSARGHELRVMPAHASIQRKGC